MRPVMSSIEGEYRRYQHMAEAAFGQLSETELLHTAGGAQNSIAVIAWHLAGNLRSRFTDFLTSDGEKPWRDRESEFARRDVSRDELLAFWRQGWDVLWAALGELTDEDLARTVVIRGQSLTVIEALHRSLAHASYHVGQILYAGKILRGDAWQYQSIPPGKSSEYNENPTLERPR